MSRPRTSKKYIDEEGNIRTGEDAAHAQATSLARKFMANFKKDFQPPTDRPASPAEQSTDPTAASTEQNPGNESSSKQGPRKCEAVPPSPREIQIYICHRKTRADVPLNVPIGTIAHDDSDADIVADVLKAEATGVSFQVFNCTIETGNSTAVDIDLHLGRSTPLASAPASVTVLSLGESQSSSGAGTKTSGSSGRESTYGTQPGANRNPLGAMIQDRMRDEFQLELKPAEDNSSSGSKARKLSDEEVINLLKKEYAEQAKSRGLKQAEGVTGGQGTGTGSGNDDSIQMGTAGNTGDEQSTEAEHDDDDDKPAEKAKPFGSKKNIHTLKTLFGNESSRKLKRVGGNVMGFGN